MKIKKQVKTKDLHEANKLACEWAKGNKGENIPKLDYDPITKIWTVTAYEE